MDGAVCLLDRVPPPAPVRFSVLFQTLFSYKMVAPNMVWAPSHDLPTFPRGLIHSLPPAAGKGPQGLAFMPVPVAAAPSSPSPWDLAGLTVGRCLKELTLEALGSVLPPPLPLSPFKASFHGARPPCPMTSV